jgi:peptidyl-dipeptidase A
MKTMSQRLCAFTSTLLLAFALAPRLTRARQSIAPTPDEAKRFIEHAEQELLDLDLKAERAAWVQLNFITVDTEGIAADAEEAANTAATNYAKRAALSRTCPQAAAARTRHRISRAR